MYPYITYYGITYCVQDFCVGSEDWMGYSLYYSNESGNDYAIYGVGGIELRPTSSTTFNVYLVDNSDGDFADAFLFSYEELADDFDGEYVEVDGGEYEARFLWMLCDAVENFFR